MAKMLVRLAEVTQGDQIKTVRVVAGNNVEARDLVVRHLGKEPWDRIRVRDTPVEDDGPARVLA